ncbi:MAG: D-Ala-D-Ala carboxypeptidase family metallohydrolase [Deltaproteobacteria bacterium]|nr:D-Ala-D-Ala carboxypeptidase family metallohydrolase [Deltaproteobacteria bacterium]
MTIKTSAYERSKLWPPKSIPKSFPKNFKRSEWDCYDKRGQLIPKGALIAAVPATGPVYQAVLLCAWNCQRIRDRLCDIYQRDVKMTVLSGWRPKIYNDAIKGASNSQHLYGRAADLTAFGVPTKSLYEVALKMARSGEIDQGGIGYYPRSRFVHVDTRCVYGMKAARWSQKA